MCVVFFFFSEGRGGLPLSAVQILKQTPHGKRDRCRRGGTGGPERLAGVGEGQGGSGDRGQGGSGWTFISFLCLARQRCVTTTAMRVCFVRVRFVRFVCFAARGGRRGGGGRGGAGTFNEKSISSMVC